MAIFSVYLPASDAAMPLTGSSRIEKARVIRDGFSWGAFFFPLIWLFWHRVWRWALLVLLFDLVLAIAAQRWGLPSASTAIIGLLEMLFVGLEARHWLALALERRGYVLKEVIEAPSGDDAEFLVFDRLAAEQEAVAASVASTYPASRTSGVIGLFPQAGRRFPQAGIDR